MSQVTPTDDFRDMENIGDKVVVDEEAKLPMADVLQCTRSQTLKAHLLNADVNNDGFISTGELLLVARADLDAKAQAKRWWKLSLVLLAIILASLAANVGLTFAVVDANKDTEVSDSGALVQKGEAESYIGTAALRQTQSGAIQQLLALTVETSGDVNSIWVPSNSSHDGATVFKVSSVSIHAEGRLVSASACDGFTIMADANSPDSLLTFKTKQEATQAAAGILSGNTTTIVTEGGSKRRLMTSHLSGGIVLSVNIYTGSCPSPPPGCAAVMCTGSTLEKTQCTSCTNSRTLTLALLDDKHSYYDYPNKKAIAVKRCFCPSGQYLSADGTQCLACHSSCKT